MKTKPGLHLDCDPETFEGRMKLRSMGEWPGSRPPDDRRLKPATGTSVAISLTRWERFKKWLAS